MRSKSKSSSPAVANAPISPALNLTRSAAVDGGPAFPTTHPQNAGEQGMSLLDYFAGKALPVVLAGLEQERLGRRPTKDNVEDDDVFSSLSEAAWISYCQAEAMLEARQDHLDMQEELTLKSSDKASIAVLPTKGCLPGRN